MLAKLQPTVSSLQGGLVYVHKSATSRTAYRAICLPPRANRSWSLANLYSNHDLGVNQDLVYDLAAVLRECGTHVAYAPSIADMSALIASKWDVRTHISLPKSVSLFRQKELPSDGINLEVGEAFVGSMSGCAELVAVGGGMCIAAHAGRDSLINKARILRKGDRKHESVVFAIADAFMLAGIPLKEVSLRCYFSISQEDLKQHLEHPEYGDYNRLMLADIEKRWGDGVVNVVEEDGQKVALLSLPMLARAQAASAGFGSFDEDGTLCYGEYPNFSTTRHPDERLRKERNLVIVHRIS